MHTLPQNKDRFTINSLLYCCKALTFTHSLVYEFLCVPFYRCHPVFLYSFSGCLSWCYYIFRLNTFFNWLWLDQDLLIAHIVGSVELGTQHSPWLSGSLIWGEKHSHWVPSPRAWALQHVPGLSGSSICGEIHPSRKWRKLYGWLSAE